MASASTYALPLNSPAHSHGHGHSRSLQSAGSIASQINGSSPAKKSAISANGQHHHRHSASESNGHAHSESHDQDHGHGHSHSHDEGHGHGHRHTPSESSYSLKPLVTRPRMRPRGESDLGRAASRKSNNAAKFGFSPIQESPVAPPPPSASWLELPEALTALLIPLPFVFASLAYPHVIAQPRRLPAEPSTPYDRLLETVKGEASISGLQFLPNSEQLLHACTLSSTTLILVGIISKLRTLDEPLDRRKSLGGTSRQRSTLNGLLSLGSLGSIGYSILSVLLPFYATMQLGGAKTALVLLVAVAAGIGSLDHKLGKQSLWDTWKRTARTRKATCAVLLAGCCIDLFDASSSRSGTVLGHMALAISVLAIPPPLPTAGSSLVVPGSEASWNVQTGRVALPKPISPLVHSPNDTLLTIIAGILLTTTTILFSIISSSSPSIAHHAILFSTLAVASATGLVFLSLPASLKTQKKPGLVVGCVLVAFSAILQAPSTWRAWTHVPLLCALSFAAVWFDTTPSLAHQHSHHHSHAGHKHTAIHSHGHGHDHHLHGGHSKLTGFLLSRCTPGSMIHSIMIEKDSRRIAYFGVLNLAFMAVQFFYGFVSGSLGLLTDSIHMLFDCAGLAVGLAAAVMSKWPPNARFPYGYGKVDTLSGFANGVFLMLVSAEIIFDAFERLWEGHELQRLNELLIVSVLGFLVNIVGLTAFGHAHHGHDHGGGGHHHHGDGDHGHGHSHDNENMQGIFLHILADALGSVAVIISTLLTKYYGWSGWDPLASCIIAVLIFASAIPLVKTSGLRLLLSLPADVEYGIRNTLQELSSLRGVVGYAVPRFWLEDAGAAHAEVHAHEHKHDHDEDCDHVHGNSHSHHSPEEHGHSHDHGHSHTNSHSHSHHDHDHDHDHDHAHGPSGQQKILGVIHIIASRIADLEDVRERTIQFLKGRGMDVVVHVEREGDRCWCGGGKTS